MSTHQIVIIGASFAGLSAAHLLLKTVLPQIADKKFKVILVAPNEELFWKIGAPRVIVDPNSLPLDKALIPFAPAFKHYNPEQYEIVKAYATSIDPSSKTVHTSTSAAIHYDSLIIASGTDFASPIWTVTDGSEPLKAALKEIHEKLPSAETVLVAGGGPAGVETAGELGELYAKKKDMTILSGTSQLLNSLNNKKVGADAESRLKRLGFKVVNDNVKVLQHTKADGKDVLKLSNGETKTVDLYIDATGDKPNTKFVPQEWLDERNKVKVDPHTLRLDVPGVTGVYGFGSVGSYSNGAAFDVKFALPALQETLRSDLSGTAPAPRTNKIYKKMATDMMMVPIGPQQGVGVVFGWKVPSFLVKMAKSKDFMIGQAIKTVEGTG
jgi:NADH dehydrogenase FAD-containing subunit